MYLRIYVITCVFHLSYQVFGGRSKYNICNNDGVNNMLHRNKLFRIKKLAHSLLCSIYQTPNSWHTVCCALYTKPLTATQYSYKCLFITIIFSSIKSQSRYKRSFYVSFSSSSFMCTFHFITTFNPPQ